MGGWHQDELDDWLSVVMWLWLCPTLGLRSEKGCAGDARQKLKSTDPDFSSERAHHINKPQPSKKIVKERMWKIGRGSQMGAWHQDGHTDWLSVVDSDIWATLFLGDINMGTWPSRLGGVSRIGTIKCGLEPPALARTSSNSKLQTRPLVREGATK
jgi:hypothetical protein